MAQWQPLNTGKPESTDKQNVTVITNRLDNLETGFTGANSIQPVINGGTIDGAIINDTTIGSSTPKPGSFTDVDCESLDVDNITVDGNTISSTDTNGDINLTPNGTGKTVVTNIALGSTSNPSFTVEKRTVTWTGSIDHSGVGTVTSDGLVYTVPDKERLLTTNLTSWDLTATGSTDASNTNVWLTVTSDDDTNKYDNGDTGNDSGTVEYAVGDYTNATNVYFNITATSVLGTRAVTEVVFDIYVLVLDI